MEEQIGYKKPPLHTRFKPGQSGNPAGRPRGKVSIVKDLLDELSEPVAGTQVAKSRAIVKNLVAEAMGDAKTAITLLGICSRLHPEADDEPVRNDAETAYLEKLAAQEQLHPDTEDTSPALPEGGA